MVLGASNKPGRFSFLAMNLLHDHEYDVIAVGNKADNSGKIPIQESIPEEHGLYAVTVYLRPANQQMYKNALLRLNPEKVVFNPGTENPELARILRQEGIRVISACTLVMLETGDF